MQPGFRSGPYFIKLFSLLNLLSLSPSPDCIHLSPRPDFTQQVRIRILSILSSGQGPDFITVVRKANPGTDFLIFSPVRIRILFSESGSGFYLFFPIPDFTNTPASLWSPKKKYQNLKISNNHKESIDIKLHCVVLTTDIIKT